MNLYADMFLTFARIGGLTFGGGYAMLPILEKEVVEKRGWCKEEELTDYYAIGQCTPGVIAVNTATFIGSKLAGIPGGIIATLGVVFPSMVIISIIAAFLRNFADNPYVIHAFAGLRVVVTVLVLNTVLKLLKSNVKGKGIPALILFALVLVASFCFKISSILLVVIAMVWGLFSIRSMTCTSGEAMDNVWLSMFFSPLFPAPMSLGHRRGDFFWFIALRTACARGASSVPGTHGARGFPDDHSASFHICCCVHS